VRLALMIEGQQGVTWEQWVALAGACEQAGLEGLFRSDHYSGISSPNSSLDAWSTVTALAAITERITLGTLVSPATFRHPSVLARMVASASQISGGRIELGFGAGWYEDEHRHAGFPFPPTRERIALFAEQLEILRLSWSGERFDFSGAHYELRDAQPQPLPVGHQHVIVGGGARPGTVGPAARFADEYNTALVSTAEAARRRALVDDACAAAGREPIAFSLMARCVVGEDAAAVKRRADRIREVAGDDPFADPEFAIDGTVDEVVARLEAFEAAGVQRVMLRHLAVDDLEMIELIGREVLPRVS
jgi:alkanesulfonate monooxygenase SsuD/methylene tetrahydromethanopterin reductase-like flavin-dependent oxidoreductase (luciferase family)